jgi:Fe-S-cluster containining protein
VLFPEEGDVPEAYDHVTIETSHGALKLLRQHVNGDCVYVGEHGCTIYGRAPLVCRRFDCRKYFLSMPRAERRQMERQAKAKIAIFEAARARLATLTDAERADAIARRGIARPEVSDRKRLRDTLVQS